jgi:hypothetical protein
MNYFYFVKIKRCTLQTPEAPFFIYFLFLKKRGKYKKSTTYELYRMIAFSVPSFLIHDIFTFILIFHPPSVHPPRRFVVVVSLQILCTPAIPSFLLQRFGSLLRVAAIALLFYAFCSRFPSTVHLAQPLIFFSFFPPFSDSLLSLHLGRKRPRSLIVLLPRS